MKQIGSFEVDAFKHGVKVFVGLPPDYAKKHDRGSM